MKYLILLLLPPMAFAAGDPNAGKHKSATCVACHGQAGVSDNDLWPNLAGQKQGYLVKQLNEFRSGVRKNPLMSPVSTTLTDQDVADLAAYYAQIKGT